MGGLADSSPNDRSPKDSGNEDSAKRQPSGSSSKSSIQITGRSNSGALENDLTNQQIGRYLVQRRLGSGGTAVVYQAFDQVRGRSVALKVLASTADEKMLLRFRREAMTSGALHHPNIVRTLQVGVAPHGDVAYIAMELVEGESLSALLDRCGYLDSDEAAALLAPIATALSHAHENEIVHRDVKPSNILLHPAGAGIKNSVHVNALDFPAVPMLSDFGIARSLDSPELTNLGRTVGTPAYMAPEQCAGQRYIDGRADIYSLGAVFYRCVVGRQPFTGATPQILHAHVYEPLTIDNEILRRLPPLAVEILSRSMAKQPDERYQTSREMAAALAEAAGYEIEVEHSQPTPTVTTTMTMDNLATTPSGSTSSSSILVPGTATAKSVPVPESPAPADKEPTKTQNVLPQYDLDGTNSYATNTEAGLNRWRWSSIALLFVGILVGAFTALFMSGAFNRLLDLSPADPAVVLDATATSAVDVTATGEDVDQPPTDVPTEVSTLPAVVVPDETATDDISSNFDTATPLATSVDFGTIEPTAETPVFVTLLPTDTPLVTDTNTPTASPTGTPTLTATATFTPTATATNTGTATNTPLAPPTPTWTVPAAEATSGTTTLPSTPTPLARETETPDSTPALTSTTAPTLLPSTPTWTPDPQDGD